MTLLSLLLSGVIGGGGPVFVESRIDLGTDRFEYQLSDVDGDRRADVVVTSVSNGERTFRLWRQRADATFPAAPDFRMTVPPDVVSWALLDVRPEPGDEVLLLTRSGIFSLSTTKEGLQGNLRRELALPLFPDVADPGRLPCWRFLHDVDGDGKPELLVVSDGQLIALGVASDPAATPRLVQRCALPCESVEEENGSSSVTLNSSGFTVKGRRGDVPIFPGARTSLPTVASEPLFAFGHEWKLPALIDWNGDGRLDVVKLGGETIAVRLQGADGAFEPATRTFALPPLIASAPGDAKDAPSRRRGDDATTSELKDFDGDGRAELVVVKGEGEGLAKERVALIFQRDADGKPADVPSARVKLSAMSVRYEFVDVDGDHFVDAIARTLDIPIGLATLATIRLDASLSVFRGGPGATLAREPDFKFERSFRPEQLSRVQESRITNLSGDFDGDGINDLVLTQLDGRVEIRRIVKQDGRLELEEQPFASFLPPSPVTRVETYDLSDDRVADLMLCHEKSLTFFISRRAAADGDQR